VIEPEPDRGASLGSPEGAEAGPAPFPELKEERKVVSILCVDLVGFVARSDQADPEDVRTTLRPYYTCVRRELLRWGGTVEKFIGDAVMAAFGAPVAHEDDAERAVRAALRVVQAVQELNAAEPGLDLALRAAVTTGEAVVARGTRTGEGEGIATGDVVSTAAHLQTLAPVGAVVVDEVTYRTTRHLVDYEALDPVSVKELAQPIRLWQARAARSRYGAEASEVVPSPFVGRDHELGLLRALYARAAREKSAQLVTVSGEPGVGKSRLVRELHAFVDWQPEEARWRQGRCLPYGDGITFWALGEIVKSQAGILESDRPPEAADKLAAAIGTIIGDPAERDWLRTRLGLLVGAGAPGGGDPAGRSESFAAWRRFLEALAHDRPLVLVFEDVHWAGSVLLEFVEHLWTGRRVCRSWLSAPRGPSSSSTVPGGVGASETPPPCRSRRSLVRRPASCSPRTSRARSCPPRRSWRCSIGRAETRCTPGSSPACSPTAGSSSAEARPRRSRSGSTSRSPRPSRR